MRCRGRPPSGSDDGGGARVDRERRCLSDAVSDGVSFTRIAREFHDLVVASTPNATVRFVVRSLVALWSAQEQQWAAALTKRGEYPSVAEARGAVRTHRRMVDEIAAGEDRAGKINAALNL